MDEELSDAIHNFYSLKSAYEESITNKRGKKCIVCKKPGGSIFKRDKFKLIAICGAISPCNFNIEINRGMNDNLRDLVVSTDTEYKDMRKEIIESKLSHMYYNSDVSDIEDTIAIYDGIANYRDTLYQDLYDIIENRKNIGTIKEKETEALEIVASMKEKLSEHTAITPKISDVIGLYTSTLVPHLEQIRDLKYKYNDVVHINSARDHPLYDEDNMALIQKHYDINNMEINVLQPSLISNVTTK